MTTTPDKELLELAAKAAGMENMKWTGISLAKKYDPSKADHETGSIGLDWNPLINNSDAFKLSVDLWLHIEPFDNNITVWFRKERYEAMQKIQQTVEPDPYAATRRAIVRAAAEIGKTL